MCKPIITFGNKAIYSEFLIDFLYFELKYQMLYQVLEKPDEFFNDNILGKFFTKDLEDLS